jgi:hypothetical protein
VQIETALKTARILTESRKHDDNSRNSSANDSQIYLNTVMSMITDYKLQEYVKLEVKLTFEKLLGIMQ